MNKFLVVTTSSRDSCLILSIREDEIDVLALCINGGLFRRFSEEEIDETSQDSILLYYNMHKDEFKQIGASSIIGQILSNVRT